MQPERFRTDLAEFSGVTFGLKGDAALAERRANLLDGRVEVRHLAATDLQVAVFEDGPAIDHVAGALGTEHLDLDPAPTGRRDRFVKSSSGNAF
jgi:hypothetical protein